jgi:hypothetical protein
MLREIAGFESGIVKATKSANATLVVRMIYLI